MGGPTRLGPYGQAAFQTEVLATLAREGSALDPRSSSHQSVLKMMTVIGSGLKFGQGASRVI